MRYRGSVLLASLTVVALALTGCSPIDGKMVTYDSVANHVRTAASTLETADGVRVVGTVEDATGQPISIDVRINGAGDGAGKVRRNGTVGEVLVVDSMTYVRARAPWWGADNRAETYDLAWVAVADTTIGLDLSGTLRPQAFGELLDEGFGSLQLEGMPTPTKVNGVLARRVESDAGSAWVTVEKPYQIIRIEGDLLTDDERPAALDIAITPPPATANISRDVALTLPALRAGSFDSFSTLKFDGALKSACNAQECTVTGKIRNASGDTPVTAVLNGKVSNSGTVLGRCSSGRAPVAAAGDATVSCRIRTPAWQSFYASATAPGAGSSTTAYQISASASAVAPAPEAVACLPAAVGCDAPTMTDADVMATLDRSGPGWFERTPSDRDVPGWREMIRTTAAGPDRVPWAAEGKPTVAYLGTAKGRPFVAQFDRGNGDLVAAYGPEDEEVDAIRSAIAGPQPSR